MIRSGEAAFTHCAAERFGSGVFSDVTGQFVGSGEAPFTRWKVTCIGFFTCKENITKSKKSTQILAIKLSMDTATRSSIKPLTKYFFERFSFIHSASPLFTMNRNKIEKNSSITVFKKYFTYLYVCAGVL